MILPLHADVRGGIRKWGALGNDTYGDCVVAATEHLKMIQNLATTSTWKKLFYRIGFTPPSTQFTVDLYAEFLATLHPAEQPGGDVGVNPTAWFTWLQGCGTIKSWSQVPTDEDSIHQAMIDNKGCMLTVSLTNYAYAHPWRPWLVQTGDVPNPSLSHAVALVAYGSVNDSVVTWGFMKSMTHDFTQLTITGCYVFA